MKAKIRRTGEIVEIQSYFDPLEMCTQYMRLDKKENVNPEDMKFIPEFKEENEGVVVKAKENVKEIDWEQRRYEIAKEVYPYCHYLPNGQNSLSAVRAVKFADALIAELKKK